jgi:hypothetical protein
MRFVRIAAGLAMVTIALPGFWLDFPLTENGIREAYFLGTRQGGVPTEVLKQYSKGIAELHQGNCVSKARMETPFLQVAEYVGSKPNYSAQDAVKELSGKAMNVKLFVDVCYMRQAPPPNSVKIRLLQNKKEIAPVSDARTAFAERFSEVGFLPPNGESAAMEIDPRKLDATVLTVAMDTPDGQHGEAEFDLGVLR